MRSLLCKCFIEAAVEKTQGDTSPACVCVCVFSNRKKSPVHFPSPPPHDAVGPKACFATCVRVFRTELDGGPRHGEVTDCVIVSKLNNQYSSTCWDNTIIHLSLVADCRHRDGFLCCLVCKCPTYKVSFKVARNQTEIQAHQKSIDGRVDK